MNAAHFVSLSVLIAIPSLSACSDDGYRGDAMVGPDELPTYDWCSDTPDNCWKESLRALADCSPGVGETGTLSADGLSCTYPDGSSAAFAMSVIPFDPNDVDVTLRVGGAYCARVVRDGLDLTVETSLGTLALAVDLASRRAEVSCPDGRRYQLTGTPSCGMDPDDWPFVITERGGSGQAGLDLGGGPDGPVPVFACLTE